MYDNGVLVICESGMDAPKDLSLSETSGRHVPVQLVNPSRYYNEDI